MILCCEGLMLVIGLGIVLAGPTRWWGRDLSRRRVAIGLLLMIQAPLAFWLGGLVMGDTLPGPIDGATPAEAGERLLAFVVEWGIVLGAWVGVGALWASAPKLEA